MIQAEKTLLAVRKKRPLLVTVGFFLFSVVLLLIMIWFLLFSGLNTSADFIYNQF